MRPLVVDFIYKTPFFQPLMRLVRAISVPDFEVSVNQLKIKKGERAIQEIIEGLKEGSNFIIYPSGLLKRSSKEVLGGASGVHSILQACPEANPVLIRTTGFWGSSFSRAIQGSSPSIPKAVFHGIKALLKNFIFFMPRRNVLIEIEPVGSDFPRNAPKLDFNRALENWYNQYPDAKGNRLELEPLQLVSYSAFFRDVPEPFDFSQRKKKINGAVIGENTRTKIYSEIRRIIDHPQAQIEDQMNLSTDLGMDSLGVAELMAFITSKYEVLDLHPEDLDTVGSALELAEVGKASSPSGVLEKKSGWPVEPHRPDPTLPQGRTVAEAFLNSAQRMGSFAACADDLVGVLTYKKCKKAALVLSEHFKTIEDKYVAVLLPASVGAYLTVLALQLAGKIPVMLNWTLGPKYLEEMMKTSGARKVISSSKFLDRLAHVDFGNLVDDIVFLEDIKAGLTFGMKIRGVLSSFRSASALTKKLGLNKIDENSPAVILFTSGTEAVPKGVPLSHKNIISNLRSAMSCLDFKQTDVLYGILPFFHSFGFSVSGLFSMLAGMKIAFYPDPTDSFALALGVERWKITIFCTAPTFLRGLLAAAKKEQLESVRYFVVGAERTPPELIEKIKRLESGGRVLEGYGITECSPILSLTRPNLPVKGVGMAIPGVETITIHPETLELLPPGSVGELCVRGPNVFQGYLGSAKSPFIEIEGKLWYRTGDLVQIETDGTLMLRGRLKRFTKLGGEMISLAAVEEAISSALIAQGKITVDLPAIAVCADESIDGKTQLVLFTTIDMDRIEANEIIQLAGLSRLIKIGDVKKIYEIPLMGAGKVDFRKLQAMLK